VMSQSSVPTCDHCTVVMIAEEPKNMTFRHRGVPLGLCAFVTILKAANNAIPASPARHIDIRAIVLFAKVYDMDIRTAEEN
jgi:hypothetical protein